MARRRGRLGRCTILRAPAWSLDDIDRLLATPEGVAELERGFANLLDAHYTDQSQREQIFIAFGVFDESKRAGDVSQRWLKLAPESAFANTAAGVHLGASGWKARGKACIARHADRKRSIAWTSSSHRPCRCTRRRSRSSRA